MTLDLSALRALDRLLDEALDLAPGDREAWIGALAGDDARHAPLLRELLLAPASARTADWLDRPPALGRDPGGRRDGQDDATFRAGRIVGPWRLVRELGEGGMGSVWLAERVDGLLARPVALKLPHFGARPRAIAERFAREREILATLAHPNIARLYDAGIAADGQPWLAMEYVEGRPITEWADERRLPVEGRVALFLQVLRAVQHAHANLVVHRDLKPSNILVTDAGDVRLLDFGIAKLLADGEARETELTRIAGRALTPAYASPEQISGAPITTASDVYALGVVLYELLAGRRPYRNAGDPRSLERAILDDEPIRASAAPTDEAARSRGTPNAHRLARALAGDLDTILAKALAKRPDERYATVAALAADLERHLAGEPIEARGVVAWRRALRFVARHRVAAGATAAIAVALVAGTAVALWQANEARREAARAGAVQAFLVDLFRANTANQEDPVRARQTTARELLDRGARRLGDSLADHPAAKEALAGVLERLYGELGLWAEASDVGEQRLAEARRLYDARDPRLTDAILDLVSSLVGRDPTPRDRTLPLIAEARAQIDARGETTTLARARLEYLAGFADDEMPSDVAIAGALTAAAIFRQHHPTHPDRVDALHLLAVSLNRVGAWNEARDAALEALAVAREQGLPPYRLVSLMRVAGEIRSMLDEVDEADALLAEAYRLSERVNGPRHPGTLAVRRVLFTHYAWTGRVAEADALAEGFLDDLRSPDAGREAAQLQDTRRELFYLRLSRGRIGDAERIVNEALADYGSEIPATFEAADLLRGRAMLHALRGRIAAAAADLDRGSAIAASLGLGPGSRMISSFVRERAALDTIAGRPEDAIAKLEPLLAQRKRGERGAAGPRALSYAAIAEARLAQGRAREGEQAAREALAELDVPARRYLVEEGAVAQTALARALAAQQRCAEALPALAETVTLYRRTQVPGSPWLGEAYALEASCLHDVGRTAEARERLAAARAIYASAGPLNAPMMRALADAEASARGRSASARR